MALYYLLECDYCPGGKPNSTKKFIGVKGLMFPQTIGFPSEGWNISVSLKDNTVKCSCPHCTARLESEKQMEQYIKDNDTEMEVSRP